MCQRQEAHQSGQMRLTLFSTSYNPLILIAIVLRGITTVILLPHHPAFVRLNSWAVSF
jgi:hypothetical protein